MLDEQFLAQRDGVSKCHLGGLVPSLDKWSKTSITEFEEFVKNNAGNLYITKMVSFMLIILTLIIFTLIALHRKCPSQLGYDILLLFCNGETILLQFAFKF